ncbi:MAG: hypothetical protein NXH88_10390 [Hyphomonas sp.]|nr:hypothetical protein [Hyphomonas sp.]
MSTTFDQAIAAAKRLSREDQARLIDLLQEPESVPPAALAGIEAGVADLDAGRVASPERRKAFADSVQKLRSV